MLFVPLIKRGTEMAEMNVSLLVAAYGDDATAAAEDFQVIKGLDDTAVVAAVVLERDSAGKVEVKEHGGGLVAAGSAVGAVGGFVVGLFAPPLLLATAVGAGIGAGVGAIKKRHEEKAIGVDAEEWLPVGSSAIVVVVDDLYLDRIDEAVGKATKKVAKAVDKGDYDAVVKAVNEGKREDHRGRRDLIGTCPGVIVPGMTTDHRGDAPDAVVASPTVDDLDRLEPSPPRPRRSSA